jgi:hypothetical protein
MVANEKTLVDWTGASRSSLIDESLRAGLALLWRAYICTQVTWGEPVGFCLANRKAL